VTKPAKPKQPSPPLAPARRTFLLGAASALVHLASPSLAMAQSPAFENWVNRLRPRALARGVSETTFDRVMRGLKPDTSVYDLLNNQDEFNEQLWQYINRRVSDFRVVTGTERATELAPLLARIEQDYGVDRWILLSLWGNESSYGDVVDNPKYMRPVIPALAALAYGAPRRRPYWEQELINALRIVERGWADPKQMIGSWAGAMGHTQWMPEVWLNIGVDYDKDGRINPFGKPDDALGGTARYLVSRGKYQKGAAWGHEVKVPLGLKGRKPRTYAKWADAGVTRADGKLFPRGGDNARLQVPVPGGPAFLLGQNFSAVMSYNPAFAYALAVCHLADRIRGDGPFVQQFPGGERALTVAEIQEVQRRLTAAGFDTGGADGRAGRDTMRAVRAFQKKIGLDPADGYPGLTVLARLRKGA
jgi:membrane-bound lytic murein transglycosylase B